jgi:hypothetical protein
MFLIFLNRNRSHNLERKILFLFLCKVRGNKKEEKLESDFREVFEIRMTLSLEERNSHQINCRLSQASERLRPEDKCSRLATSSDIKESFNPLMMLLLEGDEFLFL